MARKRGHLPGHHLALYGAVGMYRTECPDCEGTALVLDGSLTCCGAPVKRPETAPRKRMTRGSGKRATVTPRQKRYMIEQQGGKCLYCRNAFGTFVARGFTVTRLRPEADHFVPFDFLKCNPRDNWVIACQICNGLKRNRVFDDVAAARSYLEGAWLRRGWEVC